MDTAPAQIQAARADTQIWVDAQGHCGIGVCAPGLDEAAVCDSTYYRSGGESAEISNNNFELFAILPGLAIFARMKSHLHIQKHSDNTAGDKSAVGTVVFTHSLFVYCAMCRLPQAFT